MHHKLVRTNISQNVWFPLVKQSCNWRHNRFFCHRFITNLWKWVFKRLTFENNCKCKFRYSESNKTIDSKWMKRTFCMSRFIKILKILWNDYKHFLLNLNRIIIHVRFSRNEAENFEIRYERRKFLVFFFYIYIFCVLYSIKRSGEFWSDLMSCDLGQKLKEKNDEWD